MVGHTAVVQPGNGLNSLLPGKVVIQVTMYENILLQLHKALLQIADGVHHDKVGRAIYTNMEVTFSMKFHIREKIHETLENTDMTLDNIFLLPDDGDILSLDTSFIIWIANFITALAVFKCYGIIVSFAQFIMHFFAISLAGFFTYAS